MLRTEDGLNRKSWRIVLWMTVLLHLAPSSAEELVISDRAIVNTGHHIYLRLCAVCHGSDAKGNGPYTPMLVTAPSDLTILSEANNGQFPFERLQEVISGNELMPAHGAREMPVWGQEFADEAAALDMEPRVLVRSRILELMAYLEHVQKK